MSSSKTIINSKISTFSQYLRLIWKYRHSINSLGRQQIKSKYASTFLGTLLILVKLALALTIYCFVFGFVLKINVGESPYIIFVLIGFQSWSLFISAMSECSNSLLTTKHIFSKIYIPKIGLPISRLYLGIFESFLSLITLIILVLIFGIPLSFNLLLVPFIFALNVIIGFSLGLWVSILSLKHYDYLHLIPYLIGFSMFVTPVFYPSSIIPQQFAFLIYLNPLAYVIDLYRWIFISYPAPSVYYLAGLIPVFALLFIGFNAYRKKDKIIADYI